MSIEKIINEAWDNKDQINQNSDKSLKQVTDQVIIDLDTGKVIVLNLSSKVLDLEYSSM